MSVLTGLTPTQAAWARKRLTEDVVGWLTTLAPDGRLQSSVISFLWDGAAETILFYSRPATPKIRNIEHSPKVSFHLDTDPYGDHYLTMEGVATIDSSIRSSIDHETYRAKYRRPLEHWAMDEAETAADFSVPIVIRPTRLRVE
jgi:PPOX class probable F420-dependent enzyme